MTSTAPRPTSARARRAASRRDRRSADRRARRGSGTKSIVPAAVTPARRGRVRACPTRGPPPRAPRRELHVDARFLLGLGAAGASRPLAGTRGSQPAASARRTACETRLARAELYPRLRDAPTPAARRRRLAIAIVWTRRRVGTLRAARTASHPAPRSRPRRSVPPDRVALRRRRRAASRCADARRRRAGRAVRAARRRSAAARGAARDGRRAAEGRRAAQRGRGGRRRARPRDGTRRRRRGVRRGTTRDGRDAGGRSTTRRSRPTRTSRRTVRRGEAHHRHGQGPDPSRGPFRSPLAHPRFGGPAHVEGRPRADPRPRVQHPDAARSRPTSSCRSRPTRRCRSCNLVFTNGTRSTSDAARRHADVQGLPLRATFSSSRRSAALPVRHAGARPSSSRTRRRASTRSIFEPDQTRTSLDEGFVVAGWGVASIGARAYKHTYPPRFDRDDLYVSRYKFTLGVDRFATSRGVQRLRPRVHHRAHLAHRPVGAARRARGAQQRRRADARRRRALPLLAHPVAARDRAT